MRRELLLDINKEQKIIFIDLKDAIYIVQENKKQCLFCGIADENKLLKCSKCIGAYYCSKECQKLHYKDHKVNCKNNNPNNISFKKNVFFKRTISCYFLANILKSENSPFLPKKWFKYRFWKIDYIEDIKKFIYEVMPYDEIDLCKESLLKQCPQLENDEKYKCVHDDEMDSTYILHFSD
tara:strand:- start:128 stop:667 length:540 start_codon:yes stop_codon:yes gene_type:complete